MKRLLFIFCAALTTAFVSAQTVVTGVVTSADDGLPMPGVSILVQGTTIGTATDFDGNYELEVPDKATLVFSFMGYKSETRKAAARVDVVMAMDAFVMEEVVSLGYSSTKKAELSSAVVTISADALTDVTTSDVGNMLQGKVAGVQVSNASGQPGDAAQIRIRGTGSITASSDPVYVVDGVMGGTFNPNDVETISVLKDAGATGIYGAAAAGGVIVVTTKSGNAEKPLTVDVKATAGAKQALMGNFVMMDSEELYNFHKSLFSKGVFNAKYPKELLDQDYNWQKEFFQTGAVQDYYISASGGSRKLGYYVSMGYYNEKGTLLGTGFDKFTGRANLHAELVKGLDMNLRVSFNRSNGEYASSWTMLNDAFTKMPWDNPYDVNTGEYVYIDSATRPDNGKPWYSQDTWNSLQGTKYNYSRSKDFGFNADFQLNWHITDWLTLTSTNRYSNSYYKSTSYIDPRTYDSSWRSGYLDNSIGLSSSFGTTDILKASYQWNEHSVSGMLGWEWGKWKSEYTSAAGTGMPNGVDALNATTVQSIGGYEIPGASWAAFIQAQYDYAKRYFVTATFRAEASSIFAPEKRVGYFPSVAASWLISNEDFLKGNDIVTFLKLRGSYGITGNNNIPAYKYLATYALTSSYQNIVGAAPSRVSNPLLHWETANMAAVGVDINFIDRIEMSVDLYNTDNVGLLLDVPQAPSTGFFEVTQNAGSVRNQGIEFKIDAVPVKLKDFRWDIAFNIGFNKNRVTETPDHKPFYQTASSVNQQVAEGQDIYSWYMKKWLGVDPENGNPLWEKINEDGTRESTSVYNDATDQVVGKATPLFSGGLSTQLNYLGIFLSVNTNFIVGNKVYNYNRQSLDADGAYVGYNQLSIDNNKLGWSRWEEKGDNATHPKAVLNGNNNANMISSRYLEDGSYFRIKNITLGYDLPLKWISKMKMNKFRIYFSGDNLWTATKFSGMDPEVSMTTTTYDLAGMYTNNYPVSRTFQGGIEITF